MSQKKLQKDMLAFRISIAKKKKRISIAQSLCMQDKDLSKKKRGRPSLDVESEFSKEETLRSS